MYLAVLCCSSVSSYSEAISSGIFHKMVKGISYIRKAFSQDCHRLDCVLKISKFILIQWKKCLKTQSIQKCQYTHRLGFRVLQNRSGLLGLFRWSPKEQGAPLSAIPSYFLILPLSSMPPPPRELPVPPCQNLRVFHKYRGCLFSSSGAAQHVLLWLEVGEWRDVWESR